MRLVTVLVRDVKTGLDFASLLLVSGLTERAAEDVLRFDLGDVALVAWHAELVLSVGFLLAHRHLLHYGGLPLLGDLRRLVASVTGQHRARLGSSVLHLLLLFDQIIFKFKSRVNATRGFGVLGFWGLGFRV